MTRTPNPNQNALPAPQGVTPALDLAERLGNFWEEFDQPNLLLDAARVLRDQSATIEALRGALEEHDKPCDLADGHFHDEWECDAKDGAGYRLASALRAALKDVPDE